MGLLTPSAVASTTIGSDLANPAGSNANCTGEVNYLQKTIPGRTLFAPSSGVITQWRVRDSGGPLKLRVVHNVSGEKYLFLRTSEVQSGSGPGSGVQSFPTRLAISAGDGIAIDCTANGGIGFRGNLGSSYTYDSFFPSPPDDTSATGGAATGNEFLYNATIEADADGDVFGDETQDFCNGDASTQGPCRPGSEDFGSQTVGTQGAERTIALTNTSPNTGLPISSISASGDFVVTSNGCDSVLAAAASCAVGVAFAPTATGPGTGTLSIADSANGSPHTVALSGTGVAVFPVPLAAPQISAARLSPSVFPAADRGASLAARRHRRTGTDIRYRDSQAATTRFAVLQPTAGHRLGRRCLAGSPRPGQRRCTRYVLKGSFRHRDRAGSVKVHFTGRVRGRKLAPGRYRLTLTPTASGLPGRTVVLGFRIIP